MEPRDFFLRVTDTDTWKRTIVLAAAALLLASTGALAQQALVVPRLPPQQIPQAAPQAPPDDLDLACRHFAEVAESIARLRDDGLPKDGTLAVMGKNEEAHGRQLSSMMVSFVGDVYADPASPDVWEQYAYCRCVHNGNDSQCK